MWIGTLLGIFPRNLFQKRILLNSIAEQRQQNQSQEFRFTLPQLLQFGYSVSLFLFLSLNLVLLTIQFRSEIKEPGQHFMSKFGEFTHNILYGGGMTFVYGYNLLASNRFRKLLQEYYFKSLAMPSSSLNLKSLPVFPWLVTGCCLAIGIVENVLYDNQCLAKANRTGRNGSGTVLDDYWDKSLEHWHPLFTSGAKPDPVLILLLVAMTKICTWGWVFVDTVVIILCHKVSQEFANFCKTLKVEFESSASLKIFVKPEIVSDQGEKVVQVQTGSEKVILAQFWELVDLTSETERFVGPLILSCYASMGNILVAVFAWIAPNIQVGNSVSSANSIHVYYSSLFYMWRVAIVTYFASEVYHSSQRILGQLEKCRNGKNKDTNTVLLRKLVSKFKTNFNLLQIKLQTI